VSDLDDSDPDANNTNSSNDKDTNSRSKATKHGSRASEAAVTRAASSQAVRPASPTLVVSGGAQTPPRPPPSPTQRLANPGIELLQLPSPRRGSGEGCNGGGGGGGGLQPNGIGKATKQQCKQGFFCFSTQFEDMLPDSQTAGEDNDDDEGDPATAAPSVGQAVRAVSNTERRDC
jgi:hypothetical protein